MQLTKHDDCVLAGRIIWIETERIRICDEIDVAAAELAVRSGQMKRPVELLADNMDEKCVLSGWKVVHALSPERNGESKQEHCFDQNDGEFQMCRDPTTHAGMIGAGLPAFVEADQNENEKRRPAHEERAHEPMGELKNVIDLVTVLRGVRRLAEKLVDEREATHISPSLLPSTLHAAEAACDRGAKY